MKTLSLNSARLTEADVSVAMQFGFDLSLPKLTAAQEATATPDLLIEHNMRLVVLMAGKHKDRGVAIEDLIQEGSIALWEATQTFDPERGRFTTHATPKIWARMLRAIQTQSRAIRVPVWAQDGSKRPQISEAGRETARAALEHNAVVSGDKQQARVDGSQVGHAGAAARSLFDVLPDAADVAVEVVDRVAAGEQAAVVVRMINTIGNATYRNVLRMHYVDGLSNAQIAERMGWTEGGTRSTLSMARKHLRAWLAAEGVTNV